MQTNATTLETITEYKEIDEQPDMMQAPILDSVDEFEPVTKTKIEYLYIGKGEDDEWFRQIDLKDDKQSDEEIYRALVKYMGSFQWQNPHGFTPQSNREIAHYRPKFKNIKELSHAYMTS